MTSEPARTLNDCFLHDKDRLTHDQALALIGTRYRPVAGTSVVALAQAAGCYAAAEIRSGLDVPGHRNAAVDGYTFRHGDLVGSAKTELGVSARLAAGDRPAPLLEGTAARIFTGAPLPAGADTVVMQEDVSTPREGFVVIPHGLKCGANARQAGEDVAAGDVMITAGQRLRPQDLAALASVGCAQVSVFRPLRIAVVSTGDELRRPGQDLGTGQVYDANSFMLGGLMRNLPVELTDLGILPDRADAVRAALSGAAAEFDVILSSGGASRGEEDYLVKAVDELGQLHGWQIAIKPGRPMGFGAIGDAVVMALPGNPVAVMVCFLLYVLPVLARLGGGHLPEPRRFPLPADFEIAAKKPDRREFLRGFTVMRDGQLWADKYLRDGSGLISSLRQASGLVEIPEEVTSVARGDMVAFIPFSEFGVVN